MFKLVKIMGRVGYLCEPLKVDEVWRISLKFGRGYFRNALSPRVLGLSGAWQLVS